MIKFIDFIESFTSGKENKIKIKLNSSNEDEPAYTMKIQKKR
nr:hypothetical protein [Fusobacterium gastrosuis]